jgi:hypothetical protein
MNVLLWILQILGALLYGSSSVMKVFMLDKVSKDVPSFGALPRNVWKSLGVVEAACVIGLIVPVHALTAVAATVLALESVVFVWVHAKYREHKSIIMVVVLGLLMAFIAFGRIAIAPRS